MIQEPVFETICFRGKKGAASEQLKAECKTEVSSEAVAKVLSVNAFASVNNSEVGEGHVKYGGKVIFYVCYESDGELKKCECGTEFLGTLASEFAEAGCSESVTVTVDRTEFDLSGTKLSLSAYITVKADLCASHKIEALSEGENLIVDRKEVNYAKSYGVKKGAYPVEEEFELNYQVSEVLSHRAQAVITAVQCGVGCIIVDGEVHISALLLQNTEKSDIIREDRSVPFRMEIEYEEAMPAMRAHVGVTEKSFKTDITVDGDKNKSTVGVNVVLSFEGEAFSDETVTVANDAFSLKEETETVFGDYDYECAAELRSLRAKAVGRANMPEVPAGSRLMAIGGEKAEVASVSRSDKTTVTGVLSCNGYFRDTEGNNFAVKLETPFETAFEFCEPESEHEVSIVVNRISARLISLEETEIEADLVLTVRTREKKTLRFVKEVNRLGEKALCDAAVSVYIPLSGEDLWSLSKRLNTCPDEILATNRDLQFPLTGSERIVVYRRR